MPTISLSPQFVANTNTDGFVYRTMAGRAASNGSTESIENACGLFSPWETSGFLNSRFYFSEIKIMKGTKPTDFTGFVDSTSYSSDTLVTFYGYQSGGSDLGTLHYTATANPFVMYSDYAEATGTGIATWFWSYTRFGGTSNTGPNFTGTRLVRRAMIGTVGLVDAGEDLEFNDVNIIAGKLYRVINLKIQVPTTYTF